MSEKYQKILITICPNCERAEKLDNYAHEWGLRVEKIDENNKETYLYIPLDHSNFKDIMAHVMFLFSGHYRVFPPP